MFANIVSISSENDRFNIFFVEKILKRIFDHGYVNKKINYIFLIILLLRG